MIELRGIIVELSGVPHVVKLVAKDTATGIYRTFVLTPGVPLNRGQIIKFLGDQYHMQPGHIVWPDHIKIPSV